MSGNLPSTRNRSLAALGAAVFGLGWFLLNGGSVALDPTSLGWCMKEDPAQHVLGWLFFRSEPWGFPLGRLTSLIHPLGTTVALTDSNPLVALLLKPVSPLLPADFQPIGLWLGLCFALQGFFGAKLASLFSEKPIHHLLGGALFALAPTLLHRVNHDTLCAHWLLLGLIWLSLLPVADPRSAQKVAGLVLGLVAISGVVHPYLGAMAVPLALAALIRMRWSDRQLSTPLLALFAAATLLVPAGIFAALGDFSSDIPMGAGGFGYFSANLLTFVTPMGWSRFLPPQPMERAQYEGFAYLGLGALALLGIGFLAWLIRLALRKGTLAGWGRWALLALPCLLLAFFALSSRILMGDRLVLDLQEEYRRFASISDPLRSSGRFVWPLHYLVLTAALGMALRGFGGKAWPGALALTAALALQLADLQPRAASEYLRRVTWKPLSAPQWDAMAPDYRHLVLYPPQIVGGNCPGPSYPKDYYVPFAYRAYRSGMTINSGYAARIRSERSVPYCRDLRAQVERHELDPDTVYVVHPSAYGPFFASGASTICGKLDGHMVCVSSRHQTAFARALASSPP